MSGIEISDVTAQLDADVGLRVVSDKGSTFTWAHVGTPAWGHLNIYARHEDWPVIYRRLGEALRAAGIDLDAAVAP